MASATDVFGDEKFIEDLDNELLGLLAAVCGHSNACSIKPENVTDLVLKQEVEGGATRKKQAAHVRCDKQKSNSERETSGSSFSVQNKRNGILDMNKTRCKQSGCKRSSSSNFESRQRRRYCGNRFYAQHKALGMVLNVNSESCAQAECSKQPHFNFEGEHRGRFCAQHKVEGMVDVRNKKREQAGCSKRPLYVCEAQEVRAGCVQQVASLQL